MVHLGMTDKADLIIDAVAQTLGISPDLVETNTSFLEINSIRCLLPCSRRDWVMRSGWR